MSALRDDIDGFAAACAAANLGDPVPGCPGWTTADLLWHLTEVHKFWVPIVRDQLEDPAGYVGPQRPTDDRLLAGFVVGAEELVSVLAVTDSATPVWTWSDDHTVGFVVRRLTHETAVHRYDAEAAAHRTHAMEPLLASDGIDEFLGHFASRRRAAASPLGGSVHLHCTDVAGEWLVTDGDEGALHTERLHAKGDCAIRGSGADLLLALWRRIPLGAEIEVLGDSALAKRFVDHAYAD